MKNKIKKILEKHFITILEELEEVLDTDDLELSIEIKSNEFHCKLGG